MIDTSKQSALESISQISIFENDCMHNVKPVIIFNYMQDLAARSIEKLGHEFSCEGLAEKDYGWFLIRYRIEFDNYPNNVSELRFLTESRGIQKMTAYRDFEVYDNLTGARCLRATTSWFIVDLKNKSVVNIRNEYPNFFEYEKREDDLQLRKIRPLDRVDFEKTFHVRYDDIDINNHVNNTVYIVWAMEAIDYEYRKSHNLKNMDIYFKHDAQYGDEIISQIKYDYENNITEHMIKNKKNGEELCLLKLEFAEA